MHFCCCSGYGCLSYMFKIYWHNFGNTNLCWLFYAEREKMSATIDQLSNAKLRSGSIETQCVIACVKIEIYCLMQSQILPMKCDEKLCHNQLTCPKPAIICLIEFRDEQKKNPVHSVGCLI